MTAEIARQVNIQLTPTEQAHLTDAPEVNPRAHDAYLKGRYYLSSWTEKGVTKAIEQFKQAIRADPTFALAYSGLADAYSYGEDWYFPANEVMPQAKAAAQRALQLDDSLAEAHTSLAFIYWQYDFDWAAGEREDRRAIELDPNYAEAHHQLGYILMWRGRFDEALVEMRRASELDPLSAGITNDIAFPLTYEGKYDAANDQYRKALELDPNFDVARWGLGWTAIEADKLSEAIPELEKVQSSESPPFFAAWLGYAYALAGERGKAEAVLADLNQISTHRFVSPFCPSLIYLGLGNKQQAMDEMEKAYEARSQFLVALKVDRMFDPVRSDPRFIELLKKVHLDK
jgi:Tfp pilus assembly protein PilF